MVWMFAVFLYLLPFLALALVLVFLYIATRMAKEPSLTDSRAQEEEHAWESPTTEESPYAAAGDSVEDSSVIRVTREHRVGQD
jgi:hypothetical protein